MPVARPLSSTALNRPRLVAQTRLPPRVQRATQRSSGVCYAGHSSPGPGPQAAAKAQVALEGLRPGCATAWRTGGTQLTRLVGPDTLLGSHPFLSATGALVGTVATAALLHDAYNKLAPEQKARVRAALQQAVRNMEVVGPYAVSLVLSAMSATLAQEGFMRWLEARHASASLMLLAAVPLGLVGVETLGKKLQLPVLQQAWSGPANFCNKHQRDGGGALLGAAGLSSASFAARLLAAHNFWGWPLIAGSVPAVLGGLELVGREHDIAALRTCLTQPVAWSMAQLRRVVSQDVARKMMSAGLASAGAWGVAAGLQHLANPFCGLSDALGAAQITAGILAMGLGGGGLTAQRTWVASAQQALERYNDALAGGVFAAWGAALGKFAGYNISAFGPGFINTLAAALSLGWVSTGVVAGFRQTQRNPAPDESMQSAVEPAMDAQISRILDRLWALSGSISSGAWATLVVQGLLQNNPDTALLSTLNAVPQLAAAAVLGAVSVGMMGYALNNAKMKHLSNEVADHVKGGVEHTLNFAEAYPARTLAALGVLLVLAKQAR